MRVDVRDKLRGFGNDLGKRRPVSVSTCHRKPIEAAEHLVLTVPKASYRACTSEIGVYTISRDFGENGVGHGSTKGPQRAGLGVEPHTHTLFIGNVLGGNRGQFH